MSAAADDDELREHSALIEDFGLRIGTAMGWPPMAGRVAGALMLSETPMTLTRLQRALNASKGSVSESTRVLMASGTVARTKEPGRRQLAYTWREDAWLGCLHHQLDHTTQLLELANKADAQAPQLSAQQRSRIAQMKEFYGFMVQRLQDLVDEYTNLMTEHTEEPGRPHS